ncbi:MAG: PAS domain-containing protein, partial [Alphaproteobacteria bacterium]|nr:PAS domain-containing protein [Alphaproteobacteria bacterium]
APIGFYSVDQVGRFLFVNEALAHWLGRGAQELVDSGDKLGDFLDERPPVGTPAYAPFEGGETRGEVVLRSADGNRIHALISQSVVRTGDSLRTRSVVRDLTPERQWEEQLRVSPPSKGAYAGVPTGGGSSRKSPSLSPLSTSSCAPRPSQCASASLTNRNRPT